MKQFTKGKSKHQECFWRKEVSWNNRQIVKNWTISMAIFFHNAAHSACAGKIHITRFFFRLSPWSPNWQGSFFKKFSKTKMSKNGPVLSHNFFATLGNNRLKRRDPIICCFDWTLRLRFVHWTFEKMEKFKTNRSKIPHWNFRRP